jgi:hypothetical protein
MSNVLADISLQKTAETARTRYASSVTVGWVCASYICVSAALALLTQYSYTQPLLAIW